VICLFCHVITNVLSARNKEFQSDFKSTN